MPVDTINFNGDAEMLIATLAKKNDVLKDKISKVKAKWAQVDIKVAARKNGVNKKKKK